MTEEHKRKISEALKGKPHPYASGRNNPNYGGKCINDPIVKEKYLLAVKRRGQGWDDELKQQHSAKMKGNSNWMRGKRHTEETKERIRRKILEDFSSGRRKLNKTMVSSFEKEIFQLLRGMGYDVRMSVKIGNYLYDILIPEKNLLIEFNGDYWHMNPTKYSPTDYNKACNMTACEVWERDRRKNESALQNGYSLRYVWESDYKKSSDKQCLLKNVVEM